MTRSAHWVAAAGLALMTSLASRPASAQSESWEPPRVRLAHCGRPIESSLVERTECLGTHARALTVIARVSPGRTAPSVAVDAAEGLDSHARACLARHIVAQLALEDALDPERCRGTIEWTDPSTPDSTGRADVSIQPGAACMSSELRSVVAGLSGPFERCFTVYAPRLAAQTGFTAGAGYSSWNAQPNIPAPLLECLSSVVSTLPSRILPSGCTISVDVGRRLGASTRGSAGRRKAAGAARRRGLRRPGTGGSARKSARSKIGARPRRRARRELL